MARPGPIGAPIEHRKALKHVCRWQDEAIWQSLEGRIPPAKRRKRPTPTRDVVARLYRAWPQFDPHSLRKFAATLLLIENNYDLKRTALRLGIRARTVEDHYLDEAMVRDPTGTDVTMPRVRGPR